MFGQQHFKTTSNSRKQGYLTKNYIIFYQGMMLHVDAGLSYLLGYKDLAFHIKLLLRASSLDGIF